MLIKRYREFSGKSGGYFKEIVYLCSRVLERGPLLYVLTILLPNFADEIYVEGVM